jgi:predicted nucleic acid-binding protein
VRYYFLDSSAFVKLYANEPGSMRVRDMVRSAIAQPPSAQILMSELTLPEAASALTLSAQAPDAARRGLSRLALRGALEALRRDFEVKWQFTMIDVSQVTVRAAALAHTHRLKGADAVHLASALDARSALPAESEFYFVGCDHRLNAAASAEGLAVIDPS